MSNIPYNVVSSTNIFNEDKSKTPIGDTFVPKLVSDIKASIDWSFFKEPTGLIPFNENIKRIEQSFKDNELSFQTTGFSIGGFRNELGTSLGTLKVLAYAAYVANLKVSDVLNIFSEHFVNVLDNPLLNNHGNIRALGEYPHDTYIKTLVDNGEIKFDFSPLITFRN